MTRTCPLLLLPPSPRPGRVGVEVVGVAVVVEKEEGTNTFPSRRPCPLVN